MKKYLAIFILIFFLGTVVPLSIFIIFLKIKPLEADLNKNLKQNINMPPLESPKTIVGIKYLHQSAAFDLEIKKNPGTLAEKKTIYATIMPHHLVASSLINQNLALAAKNSEIKKIIILSPNHFLAPKKAFTSDGNWQTKYGLLESDTDLIKQIVELNLAQIDYLAMEKEHGIFDLLPYIKFYFPNAQIVPLVISENLSFDEADKLSDFFKQKLGEDTLLILSADFSHYLPKIVADFHDQASMAALNNFDYDFIRQMDIDNPVSLYVLLKYLEKQHAQRFVLLDNKNSQDFMANEMLEQTTSYVSGYFTTGAKTEKKQVTFLTFGDMMLDRNVFILTQKAGTFDFPFAKIDLLFKGENYRLANLEGPITNNVSIAAKSHGMQFTISPNFLPALGKRFEILNLANNHSQNFGTSGLQQTKDYLAKTGIEYLGDPANRETEISKIIEKNGLKIGLIGYHALVNDDLNKIIKEIKNLKSQTDFIIVLPHWGKEYKTTPSEYQQDKARKMIDAGADLILGSHPHVIEPIEIYKDKVIFYSLGNFIFDQYFSQNTSQGLSIGLNLIKEDNKIRADYSIFPFLISKQSQPELLAAKERQALFTDISKNSTVDDTIKLQIKNGLIKF